MMGITAMIIATRDDLRFDASAEPDENGKYIGWISLPPEDNYRPLVNTEPIYDSPEEAVAGVKAIAAEVIAYMEKETKGEHPIDHVMKQAGAQPDEISAVKSIAKGASK